MSTNTYDAAFSAIDRLFSDMTLSNKELINKLEELKERIDFLIETANSIDCLTTTHKEEGQ